MGVGRGHYQLLGEAAVQLAEPMGSGVGVVLGRRGFVFPGGYDWYIYHQLRFTDVISITLLEKYCSVTER